VFGFAEGPALIRRLDAMVDGVAHHVHEGVSEEVDHVAVDLGVLPLRDELDALAAAAPEVAGIVASMQHNVHLEIHCSNPFAHIRPVQQPSTMALTRTQQTLRRFHAKPELTFLHD
jgi:hypothetical protein